jgi:Protein of unknown function (DUF3616)
MPKNRSQHAVRLEFAPGSLVQTNLSGAAFSGDCLWVAGDEACGIDRLQRLPTIDAETLRYGQVRDFPLAELIDLPGAADVEADLEGMDEQEGWLWIAGSHGLKRKAPKPGRSDADNAKRLAKLSLDENRLLLARIPVEADAQGLPCLVRQSADGRQAVRLRGDARSNELTQWLADDPHFGPFLRIPGKDNGFDIEGLAVFGEHVLLGLRGPVLRGWSAVLECKPLAQGGYLRLAPLDETGLRVRKHFLDLQGLGVRDLHFSGDDLYVLAGPTMVLDGDVRVFRWAGARGSLAGGGEAVRFHREGLEFAIALPHSPGSDRAEAICAVPPGLAGKAAAWLVLYDAPSAARREGEHTVFGDLLRRSES